MDFLNETKKRAKADKKTIVLPETGDQRTLDAAAAVLSGDIANIILIGDKGDISKNAKGDLSKAQIINPKDYDRFDEIADELFKLREKKGLTREAARELLHNPLYMGVMLVHMGIADGMTAGAINATADVLRPSLQILKTAPGVKLVSAFFIMVVPNCEHGLNGVFLYADSGLVQNPSAEELAHIAVSSAKSFRQLTGAEPVVAMLSHSTKGSAKHPDADKVIEATAIAKGLEPALLIDGELQADAALVKSVGEKKAPGSPVVGKANVLVFPDLDAGNIGYKLTERLAGAQAFGPITQGIRKPVNDLSRGCVAEDIAGVISITAVQAQGF